MKTILLKRKMEMKLVNKDFRCQALGRRLDQLECVGAEETVRKAAHGAVVDAGR